MRRALLFFCIWVGLWPAWSVAQHAEVVAATVRLDDQLYVLDATLALDPGAPVREALAHGLPLRLTLEARLTRPRLWVLKETVAELNESYELRYHALSARWQIRNLQTDATRSFATLDRALDALGRIEAAPLAHRALLDPAESYQVELRLTLDIEALPAPLRVWAYLSPDWSLDSGWHTWPLSP